MAMAPNCINGFESKPYFLGRLVGMDLSLNSLVGEDYWLSAPTHFGVGGSRPPSTSALYVRVGPSHASLGELVRVAWTVQAVPMGSSVSLFKKFGSQGEAIVSEFLATAEPVQLQDLFSDSKGAFSIFFINCL